MRILLTPSGIPVSQSTEHTNDQSKCQEKRWGKSWEKLCTFLMINMSLLFLFLLPHKLTLQRRKLTTAKKSWVRIVLLFMLLPHGDKCVKDVAVGPTPSELVLISVTLLHSATAVPCTIKPQTLFKSRLGCGEAMFSLYDWAQFLSFLPVTNTRVSSC